MKEKCFDEIEIYRLPGGEIVVVGKCPSVSDEKLLIKPMSNGAVQVRVSQATELRDAFAPVAPYVPCQLCGENAHKCPCPGPLEAAELAEYGKPEPPGDVSKKPEKMYTSPERVKEPAKSEHEEQAAPLRCCRKCDGEIIDGNCACPEAQDAGDTVSMGQDEEAEKPSKCEHCGALMAYHEFLDIDVCSKCCAASASAFLPEKQADAKPSEPAKKPKAKAKAKAKEPLPLPMVVEKGNRFTDGKVVREVQKVFKNRHGTYVRSAEIGPSGGLVLATSMSQIMGVFVDWVKERVPTPAAPEQKPEAEEAPEPCMSRKSFDDLPLSIRCPSCNAFASKCANFHPVHKVLTGVEYPCRNEACRVVSDYTQVVDGVVA